MSITSQPTVTVLMPAHNAGPFIADSIKSILVQTWVDFELLIINDGSSDDTAKVIEGFLSDPRIRVITHAQRQGLAPTRNHGLKLARGHYVVHQDADDIAHPQRLEKQIGYMQTYPNTVLLGCRQRFFNETHWLGDDKGLQPVSCFNWFSLFFATIPGSTACYVTQHARRAGGYGNEENWAEDFSLWSKLFSFGAVYLMPEVLVGYRIHENSTTLKHRGRQLESSFRQAWFNAIRLLDEPVSFQAFQAIYTSIVDNSLPATRLAQPHIELFRQVHQRFLQRYNATFAQMPQEYEQFKALSAKTLALLIRRVPWFKRWLLWLLKGRDMWPFFATSKRGWIALVGSMFPQMLIDWLLIQRYWLHRLTHQVRIDPNTQLFDLPADKATSTPLLAV